MEALVYDVHGDLPALEAVLDDAQGVDRFVLGGDYALFGAGRRRPSSGCARSRRRRGSAATASAGRPTPMMLLTTPSCRGAIAATRAALGPVIHDDGSVEHRRVEYDQAASAARVREHDSAWAEIVARRIERARADV